MLGIDPGLNIMGYGLIVGVSGGTPQVIEAGVIKPAPKDTLEKRLSTLYDGVVRIIADASERPAAMAVEDLYSHYNHPRTAIIMGHARGVILLAGAEAGLEVIAYPATKIKKSLTGNGRASKLQVGRMVQVRLGLDELPEPADVSDALAVALCHYAYYSNPNAGYSTGIIR